jgi:hypothetical protein
VYCAVDELGILIAINKLRGAVSPQDLVAPLLPQAKPPFLFPVMLLLDTSGIFASDRRATTASTYSLGF